MNKEYKGYTSGRSSNSSGSSFGMESNASYISAISTQVVDKANQHIEF